MEQSTVIKEHKYCKVRKIMDYVDPNKEQVEEDFDFMSREAKGAAEDTTGHDVKLVNVFETPPICALKGPPLIREFIFEILE